MSRRGWEASFHRARPTVTDHGLQVAERIVLHSTESDGDGGQYGDDICAFWQRQNEGFGAHFVVSRDGVVSTCLERNRIAWHVSHRNTGSIGIEQAGYARFVGADWFHREPELDAVARLIARLCHYHGIPLEHSTERGICTHADCSRDFGGTHTDPGKGYPFAHVLGMARSWHNAGGWERKWNAAGR